MAADMLSARKTYLHVANSTPLLGMALAPHQFLDSAIEVARTLACRVFIEPVEELMVNTLALIVGPPPIELLKGAGGQSNQ